MLINITLGLLWLIVIVQGAIIVALVHQLAGIRRVANVGGQLGTRLPIGSLAPQFAARDLQSKRPVLSSMLFGRRFVLCFMNADCQVCRSLAFELANKPADVLSGLVIYYNGSSDPDGTVFGSLAKKMLVLCKDAVDVAEVFQLEEFPVAIVIDESWRLVGNGYPVRVDDLVALLTAAPKPAAPAVPALTQVAGQT
jgi:hypothetical protein